jgi:peptide chain release factor 1
MLRRTWLHARRLNVSRTANWSFIRFQSTLTTSEQTVSPLLLKRAREVAKEFHQLSTQLAENFEAKAAKRIGELLPTTTALKEWEQAENVRITEFALMIEPRLTDLRRLPN